MAARTLRSGRFNKKVCAIRYVNLRCLKKLINATTPNVKSHFKESFMKDKDRLPLALLFIRLSVFLVMLMWTLDKIVNPEHAGRVYEKFYFIPGMGSTALSIVAGLELLLILGFVVGFAKRFTYGAMLVFHAVSTLSSYGQYLDPFKNLLFFAAWPMLAACFALYLLRDEDTLWVLGSRGR